MVRRLSLYEFYFRICCFLLPVVAFILCGLALTRSGLIHPRPDHHLFLLGIPLTLVWIVCALHFEVTSVESLVLVPNNLRNSLKAIAWTFMSGFSVLFFYRGATFSRLMLGSSTVVLLLLLLLLRSAFIRLLRQSNTQVEPLRVVILGADEIARKTSERLKNSLLVPCETVAFVRIPGQQASEAIPDVPLLELEQLLGTNIRKFADDIVIAGTPEVLPLLSDLIGQLRQLAIPIRFCLDFGSDVKVRDRFFRLGGTHILDVQIAPSETISYVVLKRAFDVVFSLAALVVASIPMLLIALAIKLSSPGPVLFAQERVGLNGRCFRMLKFRTMRVGSQQESDTRWTTVGDDRRTPLGTFLRSWSLDELPQFFNVLLGEMSVVGPRPERPHFVEKFNGEIDAYNTRHHLKSGITGWAQVHGLRGDTSVARRVEFDLYYLKNWSLAFDVRIILMTIFSGFRAENAY